MTLMYCWLLQSEWSLWVWVWMSVCVWVWKGMADIGYQFTTIKVQ